jgi:hypothetical protein
MNQLRVTLIVGLVVVACTMGIWSASAKKRGGPSIATCKPGKPCVCTGIGACVRTCSGPGCSFEFHATGSCTFNCPRGTCTSTSDGAGASVLNCPGNGCTMSCSGVGTCTLAGCKKDCTASCSGVGVCTNTCKGSSCR